MSEETALPKILVVDDEAEIRQLVTLCLTKSHFSVMAAANTEEACRLLVDGQFDAVISDVMMPGEDGIAFLGRVHDSWPDLPVILMTGHAQLQMAVNAIKNGAFDFIHKPFDFDLLRKIVNRAVNYRNLQRMEKNYRAELEDTVIKRTAALKESMLELDFARASLQQAANEKNSFMSTVSHEMRTPMNGIIGSLDLLAEEGLSGAAAEFLAMARQSADSMLAMINQLLSFNAATIQNGGALQRDLIDLRSLLHSVVVEQQPQFTRKKIDLSLHLADNLPEKIWTDREKFCRLFEILLGNALKFTENGTVKLEASVKVTPEGDKLLVCKVEDSGIGIPEGMLEKIFEPFVQGDGTYTRRYNGVGLGLAIARQNVLLLNGQIHAEHVPAGGSCFVVTIKIITP